MQAINSDLKLYVTLIFPDVVPQLKTFFSLPNYCPKDLSVALLFTLLLSLFSFQGALLRLDARWKHSIS